MRSPLTTGRSLTFSTEAANVAVGSEVSSPVFYVREPGDRVTVPGTLPAGTAGMHHVLGPAVDVFLGLSAAWGASTLRFYGDTNPSMANRQVWLNVVQTADVSWSTAAPGQDSRGVDIATPLRSPFVYWQVVFQNKTGAEMTLVRLAVRGGGY